MISPELQSRVQVWRQKANAGTLSIDEMREAIAALRGGRLAAANTSKPTGSKGVYLKKVSVSSTMGVGVRVDQASLQQQPQA